MSGFVSLRFIWADVAINNHLADPLAYLTAKTDGLEELVVEIPEATGLSEADIDDVPTFPVSNLKPLPIITSTANLNWPSASASENFFDRALADGKLEGGIESMGMLLVPLPHPHWMHGHGRQRSMMQSILRKKGGSWTPMEKSFTRSKGKTL